LVLALAVPPLAQRDLLITVTFGVVLLSILLQGLTIKPLLHRLAIVRRHDGAKIHGVFCRHCLSKCGSARTSVARNGRNVVAMQSAESAGIPILSLLLDRT
jgi:NhaP-type Na+/H+ and K+/H+ antiporter